MRKRLLLVVLLASGTVQSHAHASGLLTGNCLSGDCAYDKIWSLCTLYKDETNPVLREFTLHGRLQVQYADGNSNGHFDIQDFSNGGPANAQTVWGNKFEARRSRLGFSSTWFQSWMLDGQMDADTTDGPADFYRDLYELYLTYRSSAALNVTIGKMKTRFGREREIPDSEVLTFERSLLSNLLYPGELTGIKVNGTGLAGHWLYELGVYGSGRTREFAGFGHGSLILGKVGYDYAAQAGLTNAVVSLDCLHNSGPGYKEQDRGVYYALASPSFTDSIALTNDITLGRFGLITDISYGFGFSGTARQAGEPQVINQADVLGITFVPSCFITERLQWVGLFQVATSADGTGLSLYSRYEKHAPVVAPTKPGKDTGNTYTSGYAGLNYYLYGHKLKFMNGIVFSHLGGGDYDGYTFLSGLRLSF